jgi:hypothetical protein
VTLVAGALYTLATSWRRWPDPVIDAGHQLYTAWRLSEGAVLYRDVGYLYGPLSSYLNAVLFWVFGPGMMVLVWANLFVYSAIMVLAYKIFRGAYGVLGAVAACTIFVWVFSFNQLVPVGNYTYALPYAHESTHGVLVVLGIIWATSAWISQMRVWQASVVGALCGLTLVLKPEFTLAGGLVAGSALLLRLTCQRPPRFSEVLVGLLAAVLPMAGFVLWFWRRLPLGEAFGAANHAWWTILVDRVHQHIWASFSGMDSPGQNLGSLVSAAAAFAAGVGATWIGGRWLSRGSPLGLLFVVVPCGLAVFLVDWMQAAWCLPLAVAAILAWRVASLVRKGRTTELPSRSQLYALFLSLVAFALLLRMFLHPRPYHYGFYQAALAAMVVVAETTVLLYRSAGERRAARAAVLASMAVVVAAACFTLHSVSQRYYSARTFAVGSGSDRFLASPPEVEASAWLIDKTVDEVRRLPTESKVLVVPEGLMINYLARRKSPVSEWAFIDITLAGEAEARVVGKLAADPPEIVVLISRDLREHGIARFGGPEQLGRKMMDFFRRNYRLTRHWGGDPLDPQGGGAFLLQRVPRPDT